jgi:UDP-N-acetylmuramoyl-tripeptide--D-alanyl-D-alanine ligase
LVSEPSVDAAGGAIVLVNDTIAALQQLGRTFAVIRRACDRDYRQRREDLDQGTHRRRALAKYRVYRNRGNLNNHIGLPLSLTDLSSGPDVAVVELGMNHAGEIRTLVGLAEPDVRVWTNVGDAHIGHFGRARWSRARRQNYSKTPAAPPSPLSTAMTRC